MDLITSHASTQQLPAEPVIAAGPRPAVKYVVEAIGTFFLVFTIGAAVGSHSPLAPLAIGAALMVMIYAGGHLSGGHYNPAVTLAALIRHRIGLRDALAYWLSQIGAGLIAAVLVRTVIDPTQTAAAATRAPQTGCQAGVWPASLVRGGGSRAAIQNYLSTWSGT